MAGQGGKVAKGLPKRTRNAHKKDRRGVSWRRGQARKAARREAQEERAAANRLRRGAGVPTPWEEAQRAAQARRKREAS